MILQSIELENFGLYQGKQRIRFADDPARPITLIGGLNGRGKTTLLDAVMLGLYGRRALKYLQYERIRYPVYLANHINRNAPADAVASIAITLADSSHSADVITVRRSWAKAGRKEPEEKLLALRNGAADEYLSKNWDYFAEEILPLNISRFFFFDNEKIAQLADDESFQSVKDSIRSLLGLTTVDQLIADMGRLTGRVRSEAGSEEERTLLEEIDSLQAQLDQCDQETRALRQDAEGHRLEMEKARRALEEETERFWKAGGQMGLERTRLQTGLREKEESIEQIKEETMRVVCDSAEPLLMCIPALQSVRERNKKDEMQRKRALSAEVLADLESLLNRKEDYSDTFREVVRGFLSSAGEELCPGEAAAVSGKMSDEAVLLLLELLRSGSARLASALSLVNRMEKTRRSADRLETDLAREVNDQEVGRIRERMTALNEELNRHDVGKRLAEEKLLHRMNKRDMIAGRRARLLRDSFQLQKNRGEAARLVRYAQLVIQVMGLYRERLAEKRVQDLSDMILRCFTSMTGKTSMIRQVRIDPKTLDLRLIDDRGQELFRSQLSAGEKQLFAVSIIWGLARCSGFEMPVMIDTPLARLDSRHRQLFVQGYLPHAGRQVVVLSTDEEISGGYLDLIRSRVNSAYTLIYDEATRSSSIAAGYFGGETV